jgi:Tfp pilus assembly protein PilF
VYQLYLKNSAQARSYYNKAILADADYRPALFNLAIVDTPTDVQSAVLLYNELLAMNENDSNVLFNLGLILVGHGQMAQGQSDINKAIILNPKLKSRLPAGVSP